MTTPSVDVYAIGLIYCSVCTDAREGEVAERVNVQNPTGTSSPWKLSREDFYDGTPNGAPCPTHPETHCHYLLEC